MTEQQYRVIADRDKADDPRAMDAEQGDLIVYRKDADITRLVRIERPVPTTGLPTPTPLTDAEADSFHAAMEDQSPSVPTREQIAEAIASAVDGMTEKAWQNASVDYRNEMLDGADAVLALLQKGASR